MAGVQKNKSIEAGTVVKSISGRDTGKYFVVVKAQNAEYSLIADGAYRKLVRPKLKKNKHLEVTPVILETIAKKLATGVKIFDSEIYSALKKSFGAGENNEV